MNKKRLGRGLSALIPEMSTNAEAVSFEGRRIEEIPLDKVKPNPKQPRQEFDQQKLLEMSETILKVGVIQPILVVEDEGMYTIIAGERRFRAAQIAGLKTIPAEIKKYQQDQYIEIALIENLQREDLNPIEEAIAYQRLIDEFKLTQDEVAQKLGRSRSAIANAMRLLSLPDDIKKDIISGKLTPGQVRPLLALKNEDEQKKFAAKIFQEKLTARQVEKIIQDNKNEITTKSVTRQALQPGQEIFNVDTEILKDMEDKLRKRFGTNVSIKAGKKEGKVEFSFYGNDDLDRLLQLFLK